MMNCDVVEKLKFQQLINNKYEDIIGDITRQMLLRIVLIVTNAC